MARIQWPGSNAKGPGMAERRSVGGERPESRLRPLWIYRATHLDSRSSCSWSTPTTATRQEINACILNSPLPSHRRPRIRQDPLRHLTGHYPGVLEIRRSVRITDADPNAVFATHGLGAGRPVDVHGYVTVMFPTMALLVGRSLRRSPSLGDSILVLCRALAAQGDQRCPELAQGDDVHRGSYWWGRSYSVGRVLRGMTTAGPGPSLTSVMTAAATAALMMWWRQ